MSRATKAAKRAANRLSVHASVAATGASFTGSQWLYPSAGDSQFRGWRPNLDREAWAVMPQTRHRAMLSDARYIYAGSGGVAGAVRKKADYAVGWAWTPRYTGTNDFFRRISDKVIQGWMETCDLRGAGYDWHTGLRLASMALDRDGDVFAVLTKDPDTEGPRIQWLEAHRIATPNDYALAADRMNVVPANEQTGGYAGRRVNCGVIYEDNQRPVGYNLIPWQTTYGAPNPWNILPAESVIHLFDAEWHSQVRGIPSLIRAILDWYDIHETVNAEKLAVKLNSRLTLIETNETGRRELGREALGAGRIPTAGEQSIQTQTIAEGLIRYIKPTGKIEAHESNRPGPAWQGFMEFLTRGAFHGMDLPFEFAWDASKIGGANVRAIVGQVQRAIDTRQRVLYRAARQMVLYAVSTYMRRGDIPFAPDWWSWEFSYPAKYSVDIGRDSQNRREDFSMGLQSLTEILAEDGRDTREHLQQRANDYLAAKAIAEATNTPLEWILNPAKTFNAPVVIDPSQP